ncbi:hypothetical protein BKA58DRAFT_382962 [Alternaria rosae]|uniref:uncharacterized protein n=1 Tax=Alternaria rosae TaxID=1187941 RepID=UPI001E8EA6DC|nr:uncharacterized protein BKA58DRAFT_382962 [Alternaria rosae]KAH6872875.1 hypothetical protein BKA58DRAFT_382962 [Alternaria rosae]
MTNDKAVPAFMDLPLEVRHSIFEHVAARGVKPKKLLRYWFEKKEVKEFVAQDAIDNPNGPAPRVAYGNDYDDYDEESAVSDYNSEEEEDQEEEENAVEDSENEEEDEDGNEDEGAEQEDGSDEDEAEDESESDIDGEDEDEEVEEAVAGAHDTQPATAGVHPAQAAAQVDPDDQSEDETAEEKPGQGRVGEGKSEDEGDDGEETEGAQLHNEEEAEGDSEDDEDLADDGGNAAAIVVTAQPPPPPPPPPPPAPVFRPHNKWRHIPNFMRITHCPPPVQLLLTSRQLNNEAKNWFYDVAVLRIDATGSFAHTSFFEEAFSQITDAAFSPMENIRKVNITFVWDSAWIRADTTDSIAAIFPALLRQRSNFVFEILLKAPDLREVVIHWHDSVQDDESANLMLDNLAPFHTLAATVNIIEHYIAADARPKKHSIAGKRRVEFQNILDMGLDRLF